MMSPEQEVLLAPEESGITSPIQSPVGNSPGPAVVLQGLRKSFGSQIVLNAMDLTVASGETLAVLGRSGTGKSVLLKLIIGLQKPDSGSIQIHGQEITRLPLDAMNELRKKMGFLFQHAALYDSLTVEQNVAFPLKRHTKMTDSEQGDRVKELLAGVGMEADLQKMPSDLSGGMQKRVGLARALALKPGILLLDEPTAGQDYRSYTSFIEYLRGLPELDALLVITHDLDLALRFTQRVMLLKEGNLVADGPPLQVLADPALLEACNLRPTSLLRYLLAERNAVA